jgi:hypothetical protein
MSTTAVKERPVLFSGPMVRAILDGRKTQTRRVIKPQPERIKGKFNWEWRPTKEQTPRIRWVKDSVDIHCQHCSSWANFCPHGKLGDRLRISEEVKIAVVDDFDGDLISVTYSADNLYSERYADPDLIGKVKAYKTGHLRGVHLPPAYARPTRLEITGVRVERLQDISHEDAIAEGIEPIEPKGWKDYQGTAQRYMSPATSFQSLWFSINGLESWQANPWVWVIEFKKV